MALPEAILCFSKQRAVPSHLDFWDSLLFLRLYVPGAIRTPDRRLRRALLYPAELLGLNVKLSWSG
jgi:hypothetical protein